MLLPMLLLLCSTGLLDWRYEGILPLGGPNNMPPVPEPPPTPLVVREDMGEMLVVLPDNHAAAILASRSGSAPVPNEDVDEASLSCCCCCWYCLRIEFGDGESLSSMSPSSKDLALSERPLLAFALPPRAATGKVLTTLASHVFILPRELRLAPVDGLLPDPVR